MQPLFHHYIIVDWSASSVPKTGKDSIWIAHFESAAENCQSWNPATRKAAAAKVLALLNKIETSGERALVGFDFAFGYPAGTATALGLRDGNTPPWQSMQTLLKTQVWDHETNANTRFAFAASLNERISAGAHPFWGGPKSALSNSLSLQKGDFAKRDSLPEHRLCEAHIRHTYKVSPKSVWQLAYTGAVGSQTLLGIPAIASLRSCLSRARLWPFETGLRSLDHNALQNVSAVFAEIYPSILPVSPKPGQIKDEIQVRNLAACFESLDSTGDLGGAFGAPEGLDRQDIHKIEAEEGWILTK